VGDVSISSEDAHDREISVASNDTLVAMLPAGREEKSPSANGEGEAVGMGASTFIRLLKKSIPTKGERKKGRVIIFMLREGSCDLGGVAVGVGKNREKKKGESDRTELWVKKGLLGCLFQKGQSRFLLTPSHEQFRKNKNPNWGEKGERMSFRRTKESST